MNVNLQKAEFVRSAAKAGDFPRDRLPQVAFAGRSNVGKSSVINRLLNRKNFARVGAAPGKTTHINYFLIDGAFYLVEPISYFPVFGPTGTYIGILSGNISQIRLPAASTAQDVLGVEPSSHKGEVVGILAICGSVVTNILFLTVAVVAGSTLLAFLPESVTSAMANYILPSLFGACFASMAVKKLKIALYALPMAIILRLLGVPAWITIVCCIFGTILITYFLYKKKLIK